MRLLRSILFAVAALLAPVASVAADPSFVPVFREDFPDAFVLLHGSEFIAYATNNGPNVPMARSTDLVHWAFVGDANGNKRDALPKLGSWAKTGFTWAPEVLQLGGKYLLYYTASDSRKNSQCIGVAVASDPLGPFVDSNPEPIVCQTALGGSIDASPFRDTTASSISTSRTTGTGLHARTSLWGQPLAADGLSVTGQPVELLKDDQGWEERVVEAPTMVRSPAGYELFFSGGFFGWNPEEGGLSPYAMGYASCSGPARALRAGEREPDPSQLQRPRGGMPQRPRPPEHLHRRHSAPSSASTPGRRRAAAASRTTAATSMSRPCSGRTASRRSAPSLR